MHPSEKPKQIKLWKNSNSMGKKNKKMRAENGVANESQSLTQTNKESPSPAPKKHFKKKFVANNSTPVREQNPQNFKRKNESSEQSPAKKFKPGNVKKKNWKLLNKKNKKPTEGEEKEKIKPEHMKKKERKLFRVKQKTKEDKFEIGKSLKNLWEELRREGCKPEKKGLLLKQACDMLKGRAKEFTFAHDTVRVLECVLSLGAETHRTLLFEELKSEFLPLAKSKYGKFFLMKMLKYGTKEQKDAIMKTFHGKVTSLMKHAEAAEVLELAFNEHANAQHRSELVQEFYGASFKFFKDSDVHSLNKLLEKNPEKKPVIIANMKEELLKVLNKAVAKHSIVHNVLWQFMSHADPSSKSEVIEALRDVVPEILHSQDGYRVAMHCVWHGSVKDRKIIIKSMKTFLSKIAMSEHGHMVLLALFDSFDDTIFITKHIIKDLLKSSLELSQHIHGKKVLIYLLNPRDPHYIHPDVINNLKIGDNNAVSKKDPEVRRAELKSVVVQPLLDLIKENIASLYTNNGFCHFTLTVLDHTEGYRKEALQVIADLAVEPYTTENMNTHVIEHPGSSFLFKQLIVKNLDEDGQTFGELLLKTVPKLVAKSWIECNRGAFLLVSLLETEVPFVVERVREELSGCKKYLAKKGFKGAEILLKKLKD